MWRVKQTGDLYLHHAAQLVKVTYEANHFRVSEFDEGGALTTRIIRDSKPARPWRCRSTKRPRPEAKSAASASAHASRPSPGVLRAKLGRILSKQPRGVARN